ncbi:phosphotransferase family protein [Paenibacillus sp. Root52]|uniref:phosphotransferase family protein n=1 Tax=Paenibacillus sp. Root52 TaxID=1736552 RepID=UPI0009E665C5|nr:aminoglycoside phosphotransferase family protein [Paenibacillus sp. Root52]
MTNLRRTGDYGVESKYKTKLTSGQLERIVTQILNSELSEYQEMNEGWANQAYRLLLKDGQTVVLKIAPTDKSNLMRCEQGLMKTEVEALRLVSELTDVPVPCVLAYDDSLTLAPSEYFIMEHMTGKPYNQVKEHCSVEKQEAIEEQIGRYNRRLNGIKGEQFGYFSTGRQRYSTWKEAFLQLMDDVLIDGEKAGITFSMPYEELERLIQARADVLDDVLEPVFISWDLWDGNVLVENGRITAIIDFERSLWADPLMEHYFSHFNYTTGFLKGYGTSITTPSERSRRALYDLYFDLLLLIECAYRQFDDQDHIQWTIHNLEESIERFRLG